MQELTAIYEAGHRLRQLLPTEQISREVLDILSQLMGHNYGAILLLDPTTGDLCTVAFQRKGQTVEMVDGDRARATGCIP